MQHVELTGNAFCASHVKKKKAKKYIFTPVQVCQSFFPKVLPPAAKLARLFYLQPSLKKALVTFSLNSETDGSEYGI